ncbi:uncharacterized protein LOC106645267 [Copidosoma floridanum]|uniref:uncharacterized protein LOC106645267 n=1 Tax=Copidosoma floridanum TaxID=29053 RepID=UPI0006C9AC60|nr:uncharacterized protein LOC106645267 [Copidosoma floridanum]XP_014216575.1 uncharacterized protein LOC106645267 [Copidosoma floridanum]XP_014216576.1 uncharacterized protein LOC106645267 [Copidosoma floridanum]XP_014216577.1 uncharacterized protein LOC106645267 [Copidosoma floridanum]XP_014216578.1 uncharacterized protein LOC106645267 [Copidosoma floridanum]
MADSGLETGSISSLQETTSGNSSINLDGTSDSSVISKKCDELLETSVNSCTDGHAFCEPESTSVDKEGIVNYKFHTSKDLFYKSKDDSSKDSETHSYTSTSCFKQQGSPLPQIHANGVKVCEDSFNSDKIAFGTKTSIQWQHNNLNDLSTSSSCSNYFFIDASSLNDEDAITTPTTSATTTIISTLTSTNNLSRHLHSTYDSKSCSNSTVWSCSTQLPDPVHIKTNTTRKSDNALLGGNNDNYSVLGSRNGTMSLQNEPDSLQHPTVSIYPDSLVPSQAIIKSQDCSQSVVSKESLVVEIKEADSGESALHSPCPDNTKSNGTRDVDDTATIGNKPRTEETLPDKGSQEVLSAQQEQKRPSLIRRNTFELDANDESLSSLRQEYERRQGKLVFQSSITQYSRHRIDGDTYFDYADPALGPASLPPESVRPLAECNRQKPMVRSASDKQLLEQLLLKQPQPVKQEPTDCPFASLPVNINEELGTANAIVSKLRRNEAAPIVSGGSSSSDFQKPSESPVVRRRTESTPIVSGGSRFLPDSSPRNKLRNSASAHSTTAWVVDMSDCQKTNTGSRSNSSSGGNSSSDSSRSSRHGEKQRLTRAWCSEKDEDSSRGQPSSLGYFVNLDDLTGPSDRSKPVGNKHRRRPSDAASEKSYCEFFVDLSDMQKPQQQQQHQKQKVAVGTALPAHSVSVESSLSASDAKKNMFSMFIDLNEPVAGGVSGSGRSNSFGSKSGALTSDKARKKPQCPEDLDHVDKKPKSSVFMFIESDSPVVRRRTFSSSRPAFKRHSWNMDKSNESSVTASQPSQQQQQQQITTSNSGSQQTVPKKLHKRAHSLSIDRLGNGSFPQPFVEAVSKPEPKQQEEEEQQRQQQLDVESEYDLRDTPPNSHVEILNHEEVMLSLKSRNYQELDAIRELGADEARKTAVSQHVNNQDECGSESCTETRKSETFDVSSSASGPSSTSDNASDLKMTDLLDVVVQQQKSIAKTNIPVAVQQDNKSNLHVNNNKIAAKSTNSRAIPVANFVRLSDLDNRPSLNNSNTYSTSTSSRDSSHRLSNNISTGALLWNENKLTTSTKTSEPLYKALTKKFPLNLNVSLTKSENFEDFGGDADAEAIISESDLSSLQSSMGRSGHGSTEETETSTSFALASKPYNRLGEDLLRMFLEEINPDITIDVGGRQIRAHKCILSSRCQYFAAILSGGWIENSGNIISLQGYSYNAVHFALRHIYSGESCIPDTISIVELATLADMLCLEGLKEVIGLTLKVKYCHLFHKPCNGCAVGVLECMPLAAAYGLDEVYRKSLRWVTRHFVRIWPSKEFATLPRELMDKCYFQHIVHMSVDNVLQTIMDCDKLLTTLPNVRWAEPVFRLVSNLVDASMKYLTDNFASILGSDSFQSLDKEPTWNISRLEDHILAAAERLPPEQACKTYSRLDKIFICRQADDLQRIKPKWSPLFADLMDKIKSHVEKCLVRDAARAARTNSWLKMDLELRRRIQELACLVILPNEASTKRPSRHSNFLKEPKERQEIRTLSSSQTPPNRNFDFRKMKMAISEHNDRTLKQTPLLQTRKIMNKPKTDPLQRKLNNDKSENDLTGSFSRPKSWPNKIEVKSRYLEPRIRVQQSAEPVMPEKSLSQQRKKIIISSSDSSRTSSPAMRRAACERKIQSKITKVPIKKDGKALSSDSLAGSGGRVIPKKEVASKSLGITRPESPSLKVKDVEAGLSIDSLAETKRKAQQQQHQHLLKKTTSKMDTSMSTDSLMTDITTTITTPRSVSTNKSSPILSKATVMGQIRNYDKLKKSPPVQQRYNLSNNSNNNNTLSLRRPTRSLENSTAASRSRAAAVANAYHGSMNLRKSLLDAAKAPDIPNKNVSSPSMTRTTLRQSTLSTRSSSSSCNTSVAYGKSSGDKVEASSGNLNQRNGVSSSSPGSKRSPKTNVNSRLNRSTTLITNKQKTNKLQEEKVAASKKLKSQTATCAVDQNGPKFLNQSSRSGTFLKDEPTILNKSDIETAAIDV